MRLKTATLNVSALLALCGCLLADEAKTEDFSTCAPGKNTALKAEGFDYLLFVPLAAAGVKSPLILHLHGAAPQDFNAEKHKESSLPKLAETMAAAKESFPFFVVSPVMPGGRGRWSDYEGRLLALVDTICGRFPVDRSRIYLTGFSMGGVGAWRIAANNPSKFAAMANLCSAWAFKGDELQERPEVLVPLKDMPIWIFHGKLDKTVPVAEAEKLDAALRKVGNTPRVSIFPEEDHFIWKTVYVKEFTLPPPSPSAPSAEGGASETPGVKASLFDWFLKHSR